MPQQYTGVILAGGRSTRLNGQPKALLTIGTERILDRLGRLFEAVFAETILVTNDPLIHLDWPGHIVTDLIPVRSSLTGIHAGLFHASHDRVFICACDTPFIREALVRHLLAMSGPRCDVVLPRTAEGFEPLCAVYAADCLPAVERQLNHGDYKIQNLFRPGRTRIADAAQLRAHDPDLESFFNINTPADLEQARTLAFRKETH